MVFGNPIFLHNILNTYLYAFDFHVFGILLGDFETRPEKREEKKIAKSDLNDKNLMITT